ncbi:MAG: hypothetical protein JXR46_03680 [Calditrichaceae bacterium]|nr:hypothetical protein [Calditrichaceae bacterium]
MVQVQNKPLNFKLNVKMRNPIYLTLEPFSQIHGAGHMIYWMALTNDDYKNYLDSLANIEKVKFALEKHTIDHVATGEQQPENDLAIQTEQSAIGNILNEFSRYAH